MLHSYDEIYTAKAQTSLAQMLRYAEEDMHIELNEFWDMFLISGVADLFGKGDFRFLVGMSGVEAAWEVVWRLTGEWPQVKPTFCLDKSPTYWTGWILAWYQWYSGITKWIPFSLRTRRTHAGAGRRCRRGCGCTVNGWD